MDHWRNWRRNNKKIPRDKWKQKHDDPKPMGHTAKAVLRWKFIAIQDYLMKQENSQINNLTLLPKATSERTNITQS